MDDDPHWGIERRIWHHLLRLQVRLGWLASAIRAVARWMPASMASHLRAWLPGPFLPPSIVVKQRKDGWEEEFANEICRYEQLTALQGTVVPVFFGTTTMDGTPALVLSDVAGKQLLAVPYSEYSRDELEEKLCAAMYAVYKLGVSLDDTNLVNCHLVDGRIFIVDHEQDEDLEDEDRDRLDEIVEGKAKHMMRMHWEIHKPKVSPSE